MLVGPAIVQQFSLQVTKVEIYGLLIKFRFDKSTSIDKPRAVYCFQSSEVPKNVWLLFMIVVLWTIPTRVAIKRMMVNAFIIFLDENGENLCAYITLKYYQLWVFLGSSINSLYHFSQKFGTRKQHENFISTVFLLL